MIFQSIRLLESKFDWHHLQQPYYEIVQLRFLCLTSIYNYGTPRSQRNFSSLKYNQQIVYHKKILWIIDTYYFQCSFFQLQTYGGKRVEWSKLGGIEICWPIHRNLWPEKRTLIILWWLDSMTLSFTHSILNEENMFPKITSLQILPKKFREIITKNCTVQLCLMNFQCLISSILKIIHILILMGINLDYSIQFLATI